MFSSFVGADETNGSDCYGAGRGSVARTSEARREIENYFVKSRIFGFIVALAHSLEDLLGS